MNLLKYVFSVILDFFFPSNCFGCGKSVSEGGTICEKCLEDIKRMPKKVCLNCGEPQNTCKCADYVFYFTKSYSVFYNTEIAQRGIYSLKFNGKTSNARFFSNEMAKSVNEHFCNVKFNIVCNVPAHPLKKLQRGFDQSHLLAESLADLLDIQYCENILKRKIISKTQHKTDSVSNRFENAYNSFYSKAKLNNKTVLLVDDIKTSGASLSACARSLLYSGAKEVYCITALVSQKPN